MYFYLLLSGYDSLTNPDIHVNGINALCEYWYNCLLNFPDAVFSLQNNKLKVRSDGTAVVEFQMRFSGSVIAPEVIATMSNNNNNQQHNHQAQSLSSNSNHTNPLPSSKDEDIFRLTPNLMEDNISDVFHTPDNSDGEDFLSSDIQDNFHVLNTSNTSKYTGKMIPIYFDYICKVWMHVDANYRIYFMHFNCE
jgi:hypothetical protein